jgi:5-methylcytosine-specific restriction endonuclease McrBC GTP-binding regulatory subunit McrB
MEEVQTAKEARDTLNTEQIDAEAALSKLESDEMNLKTLKLKRQSTPSTSLKMTMIAEDVPTTTKSKTRSENVEGSSLEEKIERSTMTHRF